MTVCTIAVLSTIVCEVNVTLLVGRWRHLSASTMIRTATMPRIVMHRLSMATQCQATSGGTDCLPLKKSLQVR